MAICLDPPTKNEMGNSISIRGDTVAEVWMPENVVPVHIRGDRLLGIRRGPLDVQRIVVHEIRR